MGERQARDCGSLWRGYERDVRDTPDGPLFREWRNSRPLLLDADERWLVERHIGLGLGVSGLVLKRRTTLPELPQGTEYREEWSVFARGIPKSAETVRSRRARDRRKIIERHIVERRVYAKREF